MAGKEIQKILADYRCFISSFACSSAFLTSAPASCIGRSYAIAACNALEEPFCMVALSRENGIFRSFATCAVAANWRAWSKPLAASFKSVSGGSSADIVAFSFGFLSNSENALFELPLQPEADMTLPLQSAMFAFCADTRGTGIARAIAISFIMMVIFFGPHRKQRQSCYFKECLWRRFLQ